MKAGHNPLMPVDLLIGLGGALLFVALGLEWSNGDSGYGSLSVLKAVLILFGVGALLEPVVLLVTRKTDIPVVWQALLLLLGTILSLVLIGKVVLPPEGGFGAGFYLALAGLLVATVGIWITVSREN